ncbi:MAG: dihydrofolate reductase family protein [Bradyrhizobium sp.]
MVKPRRIEGYAIVSEDGMIADARGIMPKALEFEADKRFFERRLDAIDVVFHGRHSHEHQPNSDWRMRVVLTRRIVDIATDPSAENVFFWNPTGASLEDVLKTLGKPDAALGIIGGTEVFGLFLGHYSAFYLSRAPNLHLPRGRPVFPEVPEKTPEDVLKSHGLIAAAPHALDAGKGLNVVGWHAPSEPKRF